ncbi:MAG: GNAT family N-acetyltransferase [Patescibacteria group bacterium]
MVNISVLTQVSDPVICDLNALVAQLRQESKTAGTFLDLEKIVADEDTSVIIAQDGKKIIGVAFLYIAQKMGKRVAFVEDVVVDEASRGRGVGKDIMAEVVALARAKKATYVTLTSRPAREEANKFYQKIGFELRETNVYRLNL